MTGKIYKLFIIRGFREAYYRLSEEERNLFWARVEENEKEPVMSHPQDRSIPSLSIRLR